MVIGLTGLYCAGKNHVGALLEKQGIPVLDADKLGHDVLNRETEKIVSCFGKEILGSDGKIDRKLLGKLVFGKPSAMAKLEAIVHPVINRLAEEWIAGNKDVQGTEFCVLNAALLSRSSVFDKLSAVIVVHAPLFVRFFRAAKRDKRPFWELMKRMGSQKDFPGYKTGKNDSQLFFPEADIYTIRNSGFSGSPRILEKRVEAILEGIQNGKEKIITGYGFRGSVPGNRG